MGYNLGIAHIKRICYILSVFFRRGSSPDAPWPYRGFQNPLGLSGAFGPALRPPFKAARLTTTSSLTPATVP